LWYFVFAQLCYCRIKSSMLLHHDNWQTVTNISKDCTACIFKSSAPGLLCCVDSWTVARLQNIAASAFLGLPTLKMKALWPSESEVTMWQCTHGHNYVTAYTQSQLCDSVHTVTTMWQRTHGHNYVTAYTRSQLCDGVHAVTSIWRHTHGHNYVTAYTRSQLCDGVHAVTTMWRRTCTHNYVMA